MLIQLGAARVACGMKGHGLRLSQLPSRYFLGDYISQPNYSQLSSLFLTLVSVKSVMYHIVLTLGIKNIFSSF